MEQLFQQELKRRGMEGDPAGVETASSATQQGGLRERAGAISRGANPLLVLLDKGCCACVPLLLPATRRAEHNPSLPAHSPTSPPPHPPSADKSATTTASKSPFASSSTGPRTSDRGSRPAPPPSELMGQRERSMAMVTEGLEGLIPRASQLVKLGGSVFLAFVPFIAAISVAFAGIYAVMGDSFVHGGDSRSGLPAYVDPAELLSEPTVDPYIPY